MNEQFIEAVKNGDVKNVKLLLADPRVDPSDDDNFAIRLASNYGQTEVVKLLLADPRVDWRLATTKNQLIKTEENKLKNKLTTSYLSLERKSPQVRMEDGSIKSQIPKEILRQTVYLNPYQELCEVVKNSKIPPIKLVALAKILKVKYNDKIPWDELCDKVKQAIL